MKRLVNTGSEIVIFFYIAIFLIFISCVNEPEVGPLASIKTANNRYLQGYSISFSLELRKGAQASDYEFIWDFGDSLAGAGYELEHIYIYPGTYHIEVHTDGNSKSEILTKTIEVLPSLELVSTHSLNLDAPSGLSFGANGESLWIVSDKPSGKVVQVDLEGNLLRTLPYRGADLEGIEFDIRDSSLWVIDESLAELIHLDSNGVEISSQVINGIPGGGGLEGITLDITHSRMFLLKEKDFGALITLEQNGLEQSITHLNFAPDYSAIAYIPSTDKLWILSDESSTVYHTNIDGTPIADYGIDMVQPEGLVYDDVEGVFYIVDDTTEKLHKYRFWENI